MKKELITTFKSLMQPNWKRKYLKDQLVRVGQYIVKNPKLVISSSLIFVSGVYYIYSLSSQLASSKALTTLIRIKYDQKSKERAFEGMKALSCAKQLKDSMVPMVNALLKNSTGEDLENIYLVTNMLKFLRADTFTPDKMLHPSGLVIYQALAEKGFFLNSSYVISSNTLF